MQMRGMYCFPLLHFNIPLSNYGVGTDATCVVAGRGNKERACKQVLLKMCRLKKNAYATASAAVAFKWESYLVLKV